jgi:hypothetical protein
VTLSNPISNFRHLSPLIRPTRAWGADFLRVAQFTFDIISRTSNIARFIG